VSTKTKTDSVKLTGVNSAGQVFGQSLRQCQLPKQCTYGKLFENRFEGGLPVLPLCTKSSKAGEASKYAYCRVSSADQNENRQLDAMAELNIPPSNIFVDKQSGKDFSRPAWAEMTSKLKRGDLIYVHSIDRLGRNYEDILKWWRMQCENNYCIYQIENKCRHEKISLNALGMCDDCIIVSLDENFLTVEKERQLQEINSRWESMNK
jgi:hypothetical protein